MREVRRAADDPDFLLKALGEASGELTRLVMSTSHRLVDRHGDGLDDAWSLHHIAFHMREVERGVQEQIDAIVHRPSAGRLRHVDFDDIPFDDDVRAAHVDACLEEFHYLRRRTAYLLWDLFPRDWQRTGEHPYRGPISVLTIARELYEHDLEHLWQAQRLVESLQGART